MPENGQVTFHQIPNEDSFRDHLPKRFSKQGTTAPCGTSTTGDVLYQYWLTDPITDESFFVTEYDECVEKQDDSGEQVRIRYIAFKYYA